MSGIELNKNKYILSENIKWKIFQIFFLVLNIIYSVKACFIVICFYSHFNFDFIFLSAVNIICFYEDCNAAHHLLVKRKSLWAFEVAFSTSFERRDVS